jgi:hypothetical protein
MSADQIICPISKSFMCTRRSLLKLVQIIAERHQPLGMGRRAFRRREQVSIHMWETGEQNFCEIYIPIKNSSVNFSGLRKNPFRVVDYIQL